MAENPSFPELASGRVLMGHQVTEGRPPPSCPRGVPIETVGADTDPEGAETDPEGAKPELASRGAEDEEDEEEEEEEGTGITTGTAETGTGTGMRPGIGHPQERWDTAAAPDTTDVPDVPENTEPKEPNTALGPLLDTPKPGSPVKDESGTGSDDETGGLQQSHEPRGDPQNAAPAPPRGTPNRSAEDVLSLSKVLLGVLALAAAALLLLTGGLYDLGDGPAEFVVTQNAEREPPPLPPTDSNESRQKSPTPETGDPPSVHSVSVLLDKVAKENQEIRRMQAELQAQKAELQALLRRSEDAAASAGAQHQTLTAENARLQAALERETSALHDARAELRRLREAKTPQCPKFRDPAPKQPRNMGTPDSGDAAAQRERGRLALVRHELAVALERARRPGGLEGLAEELSALERRLGRELEAERVQSFPKSWKKPFQVEKKESKGHERRGDGASHRNGASHREWEKRERHKSNGKGSGEYKAGKNRGKAPHGTPFSRYGAPQGCSGVADCARKEGREALGAALEPVQKTQFLQLLKEFMERLGWGQHFGELAAKLDGVFGSDGAFTHDRLRFVDFVEDVEELLEEVAERERGDEEAADGFEEFVRRHYGGSTGKERIWGSWQRSTGV